MFARRGGIISEPRNVDAVTRRRERLEEANAMIQLDRGAVKIAIFEQMVHAHADLQNTFVQMADVLGCRPPQQLQRLMLVEKLASVEFVDSFYELGRRR